MKLMVDKKRLVNNFVHGCRMALMVGCLSWVLVVCGAARALADNVTIGPIGLGLGETYSVEHDDKTPFKGYAQVTVQNTGSQSWGDFHFQVYSQYPNSFWSNPANVYFETSGQYAPTYSKGGTGIAFDAVRITPGTSSNGAILDLVFNSHPLLSGETATFTVYTDNTQDSKFFSLMLAPSPVSSVPIPGSALLLVPGLVGLVTIRRRFGK